MTRLGVLVGILVCGESMHAVDITGSVVIKRQLTRRNVTASSPSYQRGVAVPVAQSSGEDALAFERAHVAVYIESKAASTTSAPAATVEIEQQDRKFSPDMVVVPVGSTVSFPNLDAIFHNIFSLSKPRSFDLGNYPKGETRTVTFPAPGVVYVYCHLHPNMSAAIVVTPTRWATKADANGNFKLPEVPPGKYTVVAWHKTAGFFRQIVTVSEETNPPLSFLIPLPAVNAKAVAAR